MGLYVRWLLVIRYGDDDPTRLHTLPQWVRATLIVVGVVILVGGIVTGIWLTL